MRDFLYFDHCTATPCAARTKELLFETMLEHWASPWAPYHLGQKSLFAMREALASIMNSLKIEQEDSFVITHSGAEATALVLNTIEKTAMKEKGKRHILAAFSERLPVVRLLETLRESQGASVELLPIGPKGYIDKEIIENKITDQTALVLLPFADPFSGVLQPLDDIFSLLQKRQIDLSVDVTYALSKTPLSFRELPADYITFDAHLLGAPIGIGALFAKKEKEVIPLLKGDIGPSESVLRFVVLSGLLELVDKNVLHACTETARLRDLFENLLQTHIPNISFAGHEEVRLPYISTPFFPKVKNEALLFLLQRKQLFASLGGGDIQALSSQFFERGYTPERAQGALSFSFCNETKEKEIVEGVGRIQETYHFLSQFSQQGIFYGE